MALHDQTNNNNNNYYYYYYCNYQKRRAPDRSVSLYTLADPINPAVQPTMTKQ